MGRFFLQFNNIRQLRLIDTDCFEINRGQKIFVDLGCCLNILPYSP